MRLLRLLSSLLPNFVKGVAEGKYGEPAKQAYWALAGYKTITALVIAALYGIALVGLNVFSQCVPECGSPEALEQLRTWVSNVPDVVALLIAIGLFDAAVRIEPPKKREDPPA